MYNYILLIISGKKDMRIKSQKISWKNCNLKIQFPLKITDKHQITL